MKMSNLTRHWRAAFLILPGLLLLPACRSEQRSLQQLREGIVGSWEEVHGTRETLQFNADGTLIKKAPMEYHSCVYDFPDSKHIHLDCSSGAGPRIIQLLKCSISSDRLMIGNDIETGVYQRSQGSAPAQGTGNQ